MIDRTLPYYKWFWQDWRSNRKIQRMTYIERGLYRELLDECWVEGFIPNDIESLADICGCPVDVMADAWQVLSSCFVESDNVLYNEKLHLLRTDKDIERLKKAENGKKGGLAKALKVPAILASAKQVPSNCHIEEKRREEKRREDIVPPDGVSVSIFNDYLKIRKAKKSPLTATALNGLKREADKAKMSLQSVLEMCCERGWVGFKAEWIETELATNKSKKQAWWATEESVLAKGREVGMNPSIGESMPAYKARLQRHLESI